MKKKKKLLAAVMSVCMMATAILPSFTAYAEDMNMNQKSLLQVMQYRRKWLQIML